MQLLVIYGLNGKDFDGSIGRPEGEISLLCIYFLQDTNRLISWTRNIIYRLATTAQLGDP